MYLCNKKATSNGSSFLWGNMILLWSYGIILYRPSFGDAVFTGR